MRKVAFGFALLVSSLSSAAAPQEGVPLQVRRGFFTETDIGGFMTFGGDDGNSLLQAYLQLGVGYDVTDHIELGLHVGIGANAANCFSGRATSGANAGNCPKSDNFTVTFVDLSFAYLFRATERLFIAPKLIGGVTLLDPSPLPGLSAPSVSVAGNVGLAVGVEYATSMEHFTVGVDVVLGRFIIGPNIYSFQFFPRVKYTF